MAWELAPGPGGLYLPGHERGAGVVASIDAEGDLMIDWFEVSAGLAGIGLAVCAYMIWRNK